MIPNFLFKPEYLEEKVLPPMVVYDFDRTLKISTYLYALIAGCYKIC
jgi:hypothetical protein